LLRNSYKVKIILRKLNQEATKIWLGTLRGDLQMENKINEKIKKFSQKITMEVQSVYNKTKNIDVLPLIKLITITPF